MGLLTRTRPTVPSTIDRLRDDFESVLRNFWDGDDEMEASFAGDWKPSVDVAETDKAYEIKVDLPGIKPEDVDISVTNDRLTIQGERKEEKETKDKAQHRIERRYGSFYRSIALPAGTDADNVSADADNGVITVTVPKGEEAKAKRIAVKPK
ncbi:MAG: Hsp20/alpha crystallin family protein [Planctomycetota bacterium]